MIMSEFPLLIGSLYLSQDFLTSLKKKDEDEIIEEKELDKN